MDYLKVFDKEIERVKSCGYKPRLLLHACCAPCASAVLESLYPYFDVTVFFYNPNISPLEEYESRLEEMRRYLLETPKNTQIIAPVWSENEFLDAICGLEGEKEGGMRCDKCFYLRLSKTFEYAQLGGYEYFATTLTVSPLKSADKINTIGLMLSASDCKYLVSDFKKRDGYKKSIELSKKHGLYRQNYCGCTYSKRI